MDWPFLGEWMLGNVAGWLSGWLINWLLSLVLALVTALVYEDWSITVITNLQFILSSILIGVGVGTGQWFVLRKRLPLSGSHWLLATAGGWLMPMLPVVLSSTAGVGTGISFAISAFAGLTTGAIVGTFQWFILRRYVPQSAWWIGASTLGWLACGAFAPAAVIITAALTGLTLIWLLQQSRPEEVAA